MAPWIQKLHGSTIVDIGVRLRSLGRRMQSTEKQEPKLYALVAAVAIFREGRVLALRRAKWKKGAGLWEVVAGRLEESETIEEAAVREAREESGLEVTLDPRPLGAYPVAGLNCFIILFRAEAGAGEVVRSDEHDEHRWVTPKEFRALSSLTALSDAIARVSPEDSARETGPQ